MKCCTHSYYSSPLSHSYTSPLAVSLAPRRAHAPMLSIAVPHPMPRSLPSPAHTAHTPHHARSHTQTNTMLKIVFSLSVSAQPREQIGQGLLRIRKRRHRHVHLELLLKAIAQLHEVERVEAELDEREARLPHAQSAAQELLDPCAARPARGAAAASAALAAAARRLLAARRLALGLLPPLFALCRRLVLLLDLHLLD